MHEFTAPTPVRTAGLAFVELFVSSWEIECCAPPPVVGEDSTWRLEFVAAGGAYPEPDLDGDHTWWVSPGGRLTDGPVVALWADHCGPPPQPGRVALRGYVRGSVHGPAPADPPLTTGVVRRVQVVSQEYVLVEPLALVAVAGTLVLVDVQRSPRWFTGTDGGGRWETGVLLLLAVG